MLKTENSQTHSFLFVNLASQEEVLELKQKKNLIGSFEGSDVILNDGSISHYHALAVIQDDGILLMDLQSKNGVFISGSKVERGMVYPGDTFSLGSKVFRLEENVSQKIADQDAHVQESSIEAPPVLPQTLGEAPKNLVFIDDEYCDITFDDEKVIHLGKLPFEYVQDLKAEFIDPNEQSETEEQTILESLKLHTLDEKSLEITVTSNGIVIQSLYFSSSQKKIKVSPKKENRSSFILETLAEEKILIENKNGKLFLNALSGFSLQKNSVLINENIPLSIEQDDIFILTQGLVQIFIRLVDTPPTIKPIAFFGRDKQFLKEASKVLLIALFLIIPTFFVKKPAEALPPREIAIVYKKAPPPLPPVKEKMAQSQGEAVPQQEKSGGQKGGASQLKMASDKAPSSAPEKAPAPPLRAYKFAASGKLGSLFKSSANVGTVTFSTAGRGPSSVDTGIAVGKAGDGTIKLGSGGSGRLGSGGGSGTGSGGGVGSGSGGLYSKNGIDTASIDSRTVVLGSIDPELLRKILQEYLPQFRHCYQQELTENSEDLKGIVDLNFRIEGDGKVSKIDILSRDSRFSKKGTGCMASVLRMIDFPKPKGGGLVDVRQPLNFFAEKEKIN